MRDAVKGAPIAIVTQASASDGARMQGHEIPGNRVFGLYRNDYARRMYVTEDDDGTASLSCRRPTAVFTPYFDEGGAALRDLAAELDGVFENVAKSAISE